MAISFELVELGFDFRQTAGVGENGFVDLSLSQSAAVAAHRRGFRAEMLRRRAINPLNFERTPTHPFGDSGFSQGAVTPHLPHLTDAVDFDGAEFSVIQIANLRF
jgi:hypothetical protein